MKLLTLPLLLALGGCAMSSAGLSKSDLDMTIPSTKSPQIFATCVAETMIGDPQIRSDGTNYWIIRFNGYQIPVARWDFKPSSDGGSVAELRSTIGINTGDERVKACA